MKKVIADFITVDSEAKGVEIGRCLIVGRGITVPEGSNIHDSFMTSDEVAASKYLWKKLKFRDKFRVVFSR